MAEETEYELDRTAAAVMELQAVINAVSSLLLKRGVFTEQELQRAKATADRELEEARTESYAAQQRELKEEVERLLHKIQARLHALRPGARVDLLLTRFDSDPGRHGAVVRVIDPGDVDDPLEVQEWLTRVVTYEYRHDPYFNWVMPLEIMVFDTAGGVYDPVSLQFSAAQRKDLLRLGPQRPTDIPDRPPSG